MFVGAITASLEPRGVSETDELVRVIILTEGLYRREATGTYSVGGHANMPAHFPRAVHRIEADGRVSIRRAVRSSRRRRVFSLVPLGPCRGVRNGRRLDPRFAMFCSMSTADIWNAKATFTIPGVRRHF